MAREFQELDLTNRFEAISEIGGLKKDPYSDSHGPKIRPLQGPMRYIGYPYADFHTYILNAINIKRAPQAKHFLPAAYS